MKGVVTEKSDLSVRDAITEGIIAIEGEMVDLEQPRWQEWLEGAVELVTAGRSVFQDVNRAFGNFYQEVRHLEGANLELQQQFAEQTTQTAIENAEAWGGSNHPAPGRHRSQVPGAPGRSCQVRASLRGQERARRPLWCQPS